MTDAEKLSIASRSLTFACDRLEVAADLLRKYEVSGSVYDLDLALVCAYAALRFLSNAQAYSAWIELDEVKRERDEARALAVFARPMLLFGGHTGKWRACSPIGVLGVDGTWLGRADCAEFDTEAAALAAGRAVPWWPQAEGVTHA